MSYSSSSTACSTPPCLCLQNSCIASLNFASFASKIFGNSASSCPSSSPAAVILGSEDSKQRNKFGPNNPNCFVWRVNVASGIEWNWCPYIYSNIGWIRDQFVFTIFPTSLWVQSSNFPTNVSHYVNELQSHWRTYHAQFTNLCLWIQFCNLQVLVAWG